MRAHHVLVRRCRWRASIWISCARPEQLDACLEAWLPGRSLSLGVVDGRNVWRTDLRRALALLERAAHEVDEVWVGPSCSLMHAPVDLALETKLDAELRSWLAFAVQKLHELAILKRGVEHDGRERITDELQLSDTVQRSRGNPSAFTTQPSSSASRH